MRQQRKKHINFIGCTNPPNLRIFKEEMAKAILREAGAFCRK